MKKILILLCSISLNLLAQETPTADMIIEKYITAIGGRDAINKIQDLSISSTSESPRGVAETEIKYKFPDRYAMNIYANGNQIMSTIYDGTKLKTSGMMGGNRPAIEGDEAKFTAARSNPFAELTYDKFGVTRSVAGIEKIDGKDVYKLDLAMGEKRKWNDYYEVESGLKVKTYSLSETPRGKFENTVLFMNYKKFKGVDVMFPSQTKRSGGQMGEIVSEVQSIKVNKGLKDSDFIIKE